MMEEPRAGCHDKERERKRCKTRALIYEDGRNPVIIETAFMCMPYFIRVIMM